MHVELTAPAQPQSCARKAELRIFRSRPFHQYFDLHVSFQYISRWICIIMAELILATVGVVPVIVEAIRAYRKIHAHVKIARKCSKHLNDICLNLETQRIRFLNECILLLKQTGHDEAMGQSMIANTKHENWTDNLLEARIQRHLGESYGLCQRIISRISELQSEVARLLECFDKLKTQKAKVLTRNGVAWTISYHIWTG